MAEVLGRGEIDAAEDIRYELVEVPEWGGFVRVRGLSGTQRGRFEALTAADNSRRRTRASEKRRVDVLASVTARLCANCMVDGAGKRLYNDDEIEELGAKSASALQRVTEVAMRLSGLSDGDMDEMTEAMAADPFEGSSSA